jgi:hypothetical protein
LRVQIIGLLLLSFTGALASAAAALVLGWGFLAALLAYVVGGFVMMTGLAPLILLRGARDHGGDVTAARTPSLSPVDARS